MLSGSPSERGIDPQISSENPDENSHLPDGRLKDRARKAVTQDRDAVGQNMESHTNIFRRISLEITRLHDLTDALAYLDAINAQFSDQPDVYKKFMDILKEFKSMQSVPTFYLFLETGPLCAESTPPA